MQKTNNIEIVGNRCFVGRNSPSAAAGPAAPKSSECNVYGAGGIPDVSVTKPERKKPERINLSFGKIKVHVTGTGHITVRENGDAVTISLE